MAVLFALSNEETGSPGIICIICHQVLRHLSEPGTSSMRKHLLPKPHSTKLNKLTESEVTQLTSWMVNETAFAMMNRQGSWGITKVSSQRKFTFDIEVDPHLPNWQTKCCKLAAKAFETSKFHQDTWNRYLMLGFVSAQITWNTISNLQQWRPYKALQSDHLLPYATTLRNICQREYAQTMDAIKTQLPSRNIFSLALNGWTSTNKLGKISVIAPNMDRHWPLHEVQLAFDDVDCLLISYFQG